MTLPSPAPAGEHDIARAARRRPGVTGLAFGSARRRLAVGAIAVAAVGFAAYVGYAAVVGSEEAVHPSGLIHGCETPLSRFGWDYEAINYDQADDLKLVADNADLTACRSQGSPAGSEVVAADGVPIAGWYIPAASGIGPAGPTLLIAHGGKANKSAALKYAVPFHDAYNLVLIDLRNSGRSGPAASTWGLREQLDVRAMVDWLVRTKGPTWIAAVGNSNGAATVLAEAVDDARIGALILDSMHADVVTQVGNVLETEHRPNPAWPGSWAIVVGANLRIGGDVTTVDPIRTITRVGDRPVLILHGAADVVDRPGDSADRNLRAAQAAGVSVELHICAGARHGEVIDTCPADWARWATTFLEAARASTSRSPTATCGPVRRSTGSRS